MDQSIITTGPVTQSTDSIQTEEHKDTVSETKKSIIPEITSVNIRTIHGPLHESNYHSLECSANGLIAFPVQNQIIIAETRNACQTVIQTLDRHKAPVTKIKWTNGPLMKLASADNKGHIIIWDVMRSATNVFLPFIADAKSLDPKIPPVVSLEFVILDIPSSQPSSAAYATRKTSEYLMVLYGNHQLILYDSESGDVVFKRSLFNYSAPKSSRDTNSNAIRLNSMSLDPFSKRSLVFTMAPVGHSQIQCSFIKIDDFLATNAVLAINRYQIFVTDLVQSSSPTSSPDLKLAMKCFTGTIVPSSQSSSQSLFGITPTPSRSSLQQLLDNSPSDDVNSNPNAFMIEIKQVIYSRCRKHEVIVASTRVITIINLNVNQIMVRIPLERNASNLIDIYSCRLRSCIYTLHKSGSVYLRCLKKNSRFEDLLETEVMDMSYETISSSESIKSMSKTDSVVGFAVNPMDETNISILLSNGKIIFKRLTKSGLNVPIGDSSLDIKTIAHFIPMETYYLQPSIPEKVKSSFQLKEIKSMSSLSRPSLIKSCPPVTKTNWSDHRPLLAVGDHDGSIQIFDLSSGVMIEEYPKLHSSQVRGIEWTSLRSFMSYSFPPLMATFIGTEMIRTSNELFLTDLDSKETVTIRKDKNIDSSPIDSIRVSHLKQYFIISFRDEPFEIWDLKASTLIKIMSRKFSNVSVIEWSPISSSSHRKSMSESSEIQSDFTKENLVVSDASSCDLYHFQVTSPTEGIKEISCIHGDSQHGVLQAISWKGDQVILGFTDGNLLFWDLKLKSSQSKMTTRDTVKKIKFGPGRGNPNFLVLYQNNLELWDLSTLKVVSDLRPSNSKNDLTSVYPHKIIDIDWIGSDRPVLLTSDGLIFVTDLSLVKYSSSLTFVKDLNESDLLQTNLSMMRENTKYKTVANYIHDGHVTEDGVQTAVNLIKRCSDASLLTGDVIQYDFWSLIYHHFLRGRLNGSDEHNLMTESEIENSRQDLTEYQLDDYYEQYLDHENFRKMQKEKVSSFEAKRVTKDQNDICIEYHLILGNHQRAVQLLLESDPTSKSDYYRDSLKACLISAVNAFNQLKVRLRSGQDAGTSDLGPLTQQQPSETKARSLSSVSDDGLDTFDPVIKLAAASLIASGAVDEGVQLLLLIGKVADACKYLQSNGSFKKSIWIAKTALSERSSRDIMKRYLDHLIQKNDFNDYSHELFTIVSSKNVERILGFLVNRNDLQTAAIFARISESIGILSPGTFGTLSQQPMSLPDSRTSTPSSLDEKRPEVNGTLEFIYDKFADLLDKYSLDFLAFEYRKRISLRE